MPTLLPMDAYRILQVHPEAAQPVIRAAYRALAAMYHPDVSQVGFTGQRMAELNKAYALVRTREARAAYDRAVREREMASLTPTRWTPTGPGRSGGASDNVGSFSFRRTQDKAGPELDFGRYVGWSLGEIMRHDPGYLEWLRRHSGGIRFRRDIDALMARPHAMAR